jgi:hypothetical protein
MVDEWEGARSRLSIVAIADQWADGCEGRTLRHKKSVYIINHLGDSGRVLLCLF